eukprot:2267161-Alexandrium_andersonii.AAC.1
MWLSRQSSLQEKSISSGQTLGKDLHGLSSLRFHLGRMAGQVRYVIQVTLSAGRPPSAALIIFHYCVTRVVDGAWL